MSLPSPDVLDAFGLTGRPVPLPGGAGTSVRVGDAVLKPTGPDAEFAHWLADLMAAVVEDGFRVARPMRTRDGAWSHGGWSASRHLAAAEPAHATAPRWREVIAAGRALHRALADVPRPGFLDRRTDAWAVGDRAAWQEAAAVPHPALRAPYEHLTALLGPRPRGRSQLVHGDLTGNVLFAPGLAPAVLDFSPYWRPPAFADAIVVGDALLWHAADADLLHATAADGAPGLLPYVVRAVLFRLVAASQHLRAHAGPHAAAETEAERYLRVAGLLRREHG
ncbi:aminoglycoside phosphotransferase [Streptomyces sp. G45]|uniref:aminoglycoside phosphotransferase n=1 Tax=Streptomyces sp. G45 TaxID=3406627 RepID=UPI003C276738